MSTLGLKALTVCLYHHSYYSVLTMVEPNNFHDFEDHYKSVEHDSYVDQWYGECKAYNQAKKRCLFEGFGLVKHDEYDIVLSNNIQITIIQQCLYFDLIFDNRLPKSLGKLESIESLCGYGLTLSPTAQKQILGKITTNI